MTSEKRFLTLVNKRDGRLVDYHMDNLDLGDAWEGNNVRDRSTLTLVQADVPSKHLKLWLRGEAEEIGS